MALVRKKVKGKEYLYEARYVRENGKLKQKWKLIGKVPNSISNSSGRKSEPLNPLVGGSNPPGPAIFSEILPFSEVVGNSLVTFADIFPNMFAILTPLHHSFCEGGL